MSRDQINTSNFGQDDYTGKLHKLSVSSRENSRFGPSMNPDLFVPFGNRGNPPEALAKYRPAGAEPSQNDLFCAKQEASECSSIRSILGNSWLGIDYSDPNCNYNCFCGSGLASNDVFLQTIQQNRTETNASLNVLPSNTADQNESAPVYSVYPEDCGANFAKYLEYSKTNATFWNTPSKTPLLRRAQTSLLGYIRAKILVHGDFSVKPGKIINIKFPIPENENLEKTKMDGPWMVYRVQHVMTGIKHSMYLYIMRDGNEVQPTDSTTVIFSKNIEY